MYISSALNILCNQLEMRRHCNSVIIKWEEKKKPRKLKSLNNCFHIAHTPLINCCFVYFKRYEAHGKFGEYKWYVGCYELLEVMPQATLASWVLSKTSECLISRWIHCWRINHLFYNIFNTVLWQLFLQVITWFWVQFWINQHE